MKNKVFKMAGLRRARMEGVCGNFHSEYITKRGWAFCPWCGVGLVFAKKCEKWSPHIRIKQTGAAFLWKRCRSGACLIFARRARKIKIGRAHV